MERVKVKFKKGLLAGKESFVYKGELDALGDLVEVLEKIKEEKVSRKTKEAKVITSDNVKEK